MSKRNDHILTSPIEYLKGVGPQRAELLKKELGIFTFRDLLEHFPFRHIDKTIVTPISEIGPNTEWVQVAGKLMSVGLVGDKRSKRLIAEIADASGRSWKEFACSRQQSSAAGYRRVVTMPVT